MNTQLTTIEADRLSVLELAIETGLKTFVKVGNALLEIRDSRLYRKDFGTFEEYVRRQRWPEMSWRRAYQLMDAAQTVENLNNCTEISPTHESQIRPIAGLEAEEQREVWQKAVETAPRGKITAAHLERLNQLKKFIEHRAEDWQLKGTLGTLLGDLALRYEENPDEPFVTQIDCWRFTAQRRERQ
jgi:hypothetical protein